MGEPYQLKRDLSPQARLLQESEGFIAMLMFCDQSPFSFEAADAER